MQVLNRVMVTFDIEPPQLERMRSTFPDVEFFACLDPDAVLDKSSGVEAILGPVRPDVLVQCPDLNWVHSNSSGMDKLISPAVIESDVMITNCSGAPAPSIAEHIIAMMFAFARGLPLLIENKARGVWTGPAPDVRPRPPQNYFYSPHTFEIEGQTLAIAGLGDVGLALARRAKGLGMQVIGSRRRPHLPADHVDRVYGPDNWREMLLEADHVAITLPLTRGTERMFGGEEFRTMKPTAYIYNISRGENVDQEALIAALESGQIAGAGLDVTTPEPLPGGHPLWSLPNVIITCHTSGASPLTRSRCLEITIENIRRYLAGEPMLNLVDKRQGY